MNHAMTHWKRLSAAALLVAAGSVSAQALIDESFDGAWAGPEGTRRGILLDYLPNSNRLFYAYFTYDNAGNPMWLTSDFPVDTSSSSFAFPVGRVVGGAFDGQGSPQISAIGDVVLDLVSCNQIRWTFTPNAGIDLPATSQLFRRIEPAPASCQEVVAQCPAGTTDLGSGQCRMPNSIANELRLTRGKTYIVDGQVSVEDGGVLRVDPGVTVMGAGDSNSPDPDFIAVLVGGKIFAEGTREQPITFTGPEEVPGSWAGIVIAGRSTCNASPDPLGCRFEAVTDIRFGGNDLNDNSGVLRYVRILWAGQEVRPDEELNSLTLLGVGRGTTIEYVQTHGGLDDGFEWFGGSVDGRYLVVSDMADDMFDSDLGFSGKVQFALGIQGDNPDHTTNETRGIESDGNRDNNLAQPITRPVFSNVTLIGPPSGISNDGIRIRRGAGGIYHNLVVTGYNEFCLNLVDAATFDLAGSATSQSADTQFNHSFIGECTRGAFNTAGPYSIESWFFAGEGNNQGDPMLDGFKPAAGSPLLGTGSAPTGDSFFVPADFIGAIGSDDWTTGWTFGLDAYR